MSEAAQEQTEPTAKTETKTKEDVKTICKEFSFQLFDPDLAKKAKRLGELSKEKASAEDALESAKARYKSIDAQIKAEATEITTAINTGREMRSVWCEEVKDFEHGRVYWRPKNGEGILGERPMTNDERQIQLKLDEKKAAEAKPGAEYEKAAKEQPLAQDGQTEIKTAQQWEEKDKP